jgi:DivIVA domain-containing protein
MMTGDQIRGATFPRTNWGYEVLQVRLRLTLIAFAVDAGFAPPAGTPEQFGKFIGGFDKQAVDRFLDTLASDGAGVYGQPMACAWPFASEDPPVWDRPGPRPRRDRRPRAARRQYARDCDAGWLRVSDLPGTRLRWTRTKIVSSDGQVLVTLRADRWSVAASGQLFFLRDRQVVDVATGRPILQEVGDHYGRQAKTVLLGLQQRWFRFPVQGSRRRNGVMTAVDESGTEVLWFRKTARRAVEVVVSPQCAVTPEILCVIQLAAPLLGSYFRRSGDSLPGGPGENPPVRKRGAGDGARDRLRVRCVECGAEDARAAALCVQCGAPVAGPRPVKAGRHRPQPSGAGLAGWIESPRFSTTRLRPGYDIKQVDAFLEAIRDTFAGVREPPLTADEVRNEKFATTRLRPGYDEEQVDAFLDEVEASLPDICAECGTPVAEPIWACAECGAPPVGKLSPAADHSGEMI